MTVRRECSEPKLDPWWSWGHLLELAAVFAVGACVMNFLYAEAAAAGGVPGHDSWYHVKMAELLPEIGAVKEFPWLRHAYFTETTSEFVSHHFGFHVLLVPFIKSATYLGHDALTASRWAVVTFFAASLTLFQLILMTQRVRCRWLWLALYLLMPTDFFYRHAFVRAITPSLMFMFLILALMFRRRYVWASVVVAAFTQLYLGGVIFGPLIVICYALAGLMGPSDDRVSWQLGLWTLLGWAVGVCVYPYSEGIFEFLRLQVFGSGLTPDISVGREWKPYDNVWALARTSSWTLIPLLVAATLRLRFGPRINAREMSAVLMSFVFAALMLKSRRFVEYWPPFALLATAMMAGPLVSAAITSFTDRLTRQNNRRLWWPVAAGLLVFCGGIITQTIVDGRDLHINAFRDDWRLWTVLAGACLLVPLSRCWPASRRSVANALACAVCGALFMLMVTGMLWAALGRPDPAGQSLLVPWWCFAGLGILYFSVPWLAGAEGHRLSLPTRSQRVAVPAAVVLIGLTVTAALVTAAGPQLVALQRMLKPKYNLPQIRAAMNAVTNVADPATVIFTDDWDIFPVYFYVNSHNHYVVGLDPKFTHQRDPILWERYKKITRGQTPTTYTYEDSYGGPPNIERKIHIRLQDIRDFFGASYVIVDRDHSSFRRKLDRATEFCERLFPAPEPTTQSATQARKRHKTPPYSVYRVFSRKEQAAAERRAQPAEHKTGKGPTPRGKGTPTSQPEVR